MLHTRHRLMHCEFLCIVMSEALASVYVSESTCSTLSWTHAAWIEQCNAFAYVVVELPL